MKLLLIVLLVMQRIAMASPYSEKPSEQVIASLDKFRTAYVDAFTTRKADKLTAFFDEEIRVMPAFQETMIGKANATRYHVAFFDRFKITGYQRKELEVIDLGSQVIEIGNFTMRLSLVSGKEAFDVQGKYLNIWKESSDGKILLITDSWNLDQYHEKLHGHLKFKEVSSVTIAFQQNVLVDSNLKFELAALNRLLDVTVSTHDAALWSRFYADDSMLLANYVPLLNGKKQFLIH